MTRRPRPAETPECRRGRDGGPPRGLSHCAVFGSFEPAPLLRDADFAAKCRERACIAHFHGTAFTRRNRRSRSIRWCPDRSRLVGRNPNTEAVYWHFHQSHNPRSPVNSHSTAPLLHGLCARFLSKKVFSPRVVYHSRSFPGVSLKRDEKF